MKKKLNLKKLYINLLIITLLAYATFVFISQQTKLNGYANSQNYYSKQIEEAKAEREVLNQKKDNVNSKEYIEQVARDQLDMFLPNERVYIDISQ